MLEVHIVLLSLANLECCLGEQSEHLGKFLLLTLCDALVCKHEHRVAREDCGVGIPTAVYGFVSATQVGVVHEVVVQKRVVVVCLQATSRHDYRLGVVLEQIVGKEHQHGAYALAAKREYVADRFVERRRLAVVCEVVKCVVDKFQDLIRCVHD